MFRLSKLRYLSWCAVAALVCSPGCGSEGGDDDLVSPADQDDSSDDELASGTGGGSNSGGDDASDDVDSDVPGLRAAPLLDEGEVLFDPAVVRRIDVTIPTDNGSPSSWDSIDAEAPASECVPMRRNYYEGSITFEGVTYDGVGIRTKGGCGSWRSLVEKPSFKLNLTWDADPNDEQCPLDRSIYGQKRLTLNNAVQDPTGIHEHLAYQFYRAVGEPAPRSAAIQVYVNGEYYGVYNLIESIERAFVKRWFNTKLGRGMMYEGSYFCDLLTGDDAQPSDGNCWDREFELDACDEPPDPEDDLQYFEADGVTPQDPWKFLEEAIASLGSIQGSSSYYPAIGQLFDWQAFLAHWASSTILVDWDNYAQWQNNFRLYHEPAVDLWYVIPWGTDQTWSEPTAGGGGGWGDWGDWGGGLTSFGIFEPDGDVARLCIEATGTDASGLTCRESYVNELYRNLAVYESIDWGAEIDAWSARLGPLLQGNDPHREYSLAQWESSVSGLRSYALSRAEAVRSELSNAGYSAP